MKQPKHPSLFKFASSELSQDAFICWLLSWASPENKDKDPGLHNCGLELIKAFFEKHPKQFPSTIEKIKVKKQYSYTEKINGKNQKSYIDILCIVNDKFVFIIEDKTGTENHRNQLARYFAEVKRLGYEEDNIFPIYFKTYDQACYEDVKNNKYQVFSRSDVLSILNGGHEMGVNNAIFQDFRLHLQSIEDKVQSYKHLPIDPENKWPKQSWVGFYLRLQKELGAGLWKEVPNKAGGFMGFWWGGIHGGEICKPYLLLEQEKLCFKITVKNPDDQRKLRDYWHRLIKSKSSDFEFNLAKPDRFGKGEHMTVIMEKEYRKVKDGCIDMEATVKYLKKAESLLHEVQQFTM